MCRSLSLFLLASPVLLLVLHSAFAQSSADTLHYAYGAIENTCGPTDQPILRLTLTSVPQQKHKPLPTPFIGVMLDVGPVIPKTLAFPAQSKILNANRCAATCESVRSGSIVIERLDKKGASGHYDLTFNDGTEASGMFETKWRREGKVVCW